MHKESKSERGCGKWLENSSALVSEEPNAPPKTLHWDALRLGKTRLGPLSVCTFTSPLLVTLAVQPASVGTDWSLLVSHLPSLG